MRHNSVEGTADISTSRIEIEISTGRGTSKQTYRVGVDVDIHEWQTGDLMTRIDTLSGVKLIGRSDESKIKTFYVSDPANVDPVASAFAQMYAENGTLLTTNNQYAPHLFQRVGGQLTYVDATTGQPVAPGTPSPTPLPWSAHPPETPRSSITFAGEYI